MAHRRMQVGLVLLLSSVGSVLQGPVPADAWDGSTERVSVSSRGVQGNDHSGDGSISARGRYVAFSSRASNLAPKGAYDGSFNVFVRDRSTGRTRVVNVSSREKLARGASEPDISADGRFVAFQSSAIPLVHGDTNDAGDIYVRDTVRGTTRRVSVNTRERQGTGQSFHPSISAHGRFVAFSSYSPELVPLRFRGQPDAMTSLFVSSDDRP